MKNTDFPVVNSNKAHGKSVSIDGEMETKLLSSH